MAGRSGKAAKSAKVELTPEQRAENAAKFPLGRLNLWMMCASMVMIVLGFVLMLGSGTTQEGGFNPDIFSTRRIVVGPMISFLGFVAMGVSIIYTRRGTPDLDVDAMGDVAEKATDAPKDTDKK